MDLAIPCLSIVRVREELWQARPDGMAFAPRQFSCGFVVSEQRLELGDETTIPLNRPWRT